MKILHMDILKSKIGEINAVDAPKLMIFSTEAL